MKKDKIVILSLVAAIVLMVASFLFFVVFKKDNTESISNDDVTSISDDMKLDYGDEKINWSKYSTTKVTLDESFTINEGGIYELSGTLNGSITIDCDDYVKLILNGVDITSNNGPAIYIKSSKTTVIETSKDTINTLTDNSKYTDFDDDVVATIFSKDDLALQGDGTLIINANYEDGIASKDDLKINSGSYKINALDDGIRGKDSVYIKDGNITINSSGDGIKSTNDTDSDKGFIYILDGIFNITSLNDGLQAANVIKIEDGEFNITTGGGSKIISTSDSWGMWKDKNNSSNDTSSAKGIKCDGNIIINSGTFNLNTSDDSIHSNGEIGITNGDFTILSGDDGIHADSKLIIDNVKFNIKQSYEGLEANIITINEGTINIVSSDDGINVAGGNDSSSQNRTGANNFSQNSNNILTINGGTIYVNSSGDGLDANGGIYQNGGDIIVDGPVNDGNAALDYDKEYVVSGGSLIAVGSQGMALPVSNSSEIYNLSIYFSNSYSADTNITIVDSNDNKILDYISTKTFSHMTIASHKLKNGESYTIKINDEEYDTFTISNIVTTIGNKTSNGMNNGGNRGMKR